MQFIVIIAAGLILLIVVIFVVYKWRRRRVDASEPDHNYLNTPFVDLKTERSIDRLDSQS